MLASAAIAGGQVCQDLDIGHGIGKRESISAPHLQRPQHFQLFAIGFGKVELTLADPDVCTLEVVRDASNELIDSWLVVHADGELRKISPSHNPAVEQVSETLTTREEGCLSLPGHYAGVTRPERVVVSYEDLDGRKQTIEADGLLATCLQHEIDHLDGILFVDHLSALKRNMIMRKMAKENRLRKAG